MDANELRALADALEPLAALERSGSPGALALESTIDYLRAQADAQPVPAVPAGWKLVPVEPTQAMNNAGLSAVNQYGKRSVWETYAAMLAAAPAVPQADALPVALVRAYNAGYMAGHHDTVEGGFVDIHPSDKDTYHADVVAELGLPAAPQAEPKREPVSDSRPCTCHPDDNPPVPCAQKYALNECRAASEPTETEIEARDALLDFISENGTASEGVQHYLDRYVRAALAAKEG